jgi:hypothetical protein
VVGIIRRLRVGLEVVEEGEEGVGGLVSAGVGVAWLDPGEGLFLDGQVGVQVCLCGSGVLVAHPQRDDRGVHAGL